MSAQDLQSGKGHTDENFPVASFILKPAARAPVMAFYRFARTADDVADNADASPEEKLHLLGSMRATIAGDSDANPEALALRTVMAERGLDPRHALDLLTAFERDSRGEIYGNWGDLMDYCRVSAMPVGRYVLDVHGESQATWPASDALCAALQVINHLQDCAKDYKGLRRVYIPADAFARTGASIADLGADRATAQLRATIRDLAERTESLLADSAGFAALIGDSRLAIEVAVIHRLAISLAARLKTRDPLSQRVHHRFWEAAGLGTIAALGQWGKQKR